MEQNELYPIFLKVSQLNVLIVGGGKVAYEKLHFLLKSSPHAKVLVVAKSFTSKLKKIALKHNTPIMFGEYDKSLLHKQHIVIAATNNSEVNKQIYTDSKAKNILVNVADTPKLCDFYLGGIVTKGNVKIAISTNGKSPILTKRLRQYFEEVIPNNINELTENLDLYRETLKDNFSNKVLQLNKLTKTLLIK
ncbi:siroheme synthase [Lutibacter profundi]|uniref:precorrin-2 dehydrogenase n=1 Tax=Lutibacter profundi TaxID=1622118 RepID=A0A109RNL0_9FLAO|nr:bifunctional precorrin-2 dehydrogenase/sirohydrochlorin ferrochelatase [Lutibacter profundi]AMC10885.1 siroheme synthase [Lutibacter profundi]